MTNPFATTVGLKGVTTGSPIAWINDLPGLSTELVAAVADAEDEAVDDADGTKTTWARVQRLGLEKLLSMIEGELSKSADFQYIGTQTGDLIGDAPGIIQLASANYVGFLIMAPIKTADELYIKRFFVDSAMEEPVDTTIKVFNAAGIELASKVVTVEPDYNELLIDFGIRSRFGRNNVLFVGIDTTGLALNIQGVGQSWDTCDESFTLEASSVSVAGPHSIAHVVTNLTSPVMIEAMVRRSLVDIASRYTDRLNWAYAHICGSLLMAEKLASPRMNLFTNTNRLYTEEQEPKLMEEAKTLIRPVARQMLKDLAPNQVVISNTEGGPFDSGYAQGSFV